MPTLLRIFFRLLYHQFAFAYDLVAAAVSFGQWKNWTQEVIPFIKGTRILEIGHGPGHLQRVLLTLRHSSGRARKLDSVAMDESAAMGGLAQRNIRAGFRYAAKDKSAATQPPALAMTKKINLTRGLAQGLPFASKSFDTILATFPAEYITDPLTLSEVKRCLSDGGRFVVLPVAMPENRFLSWLFKVTGQAPSDATKIIQERLEEPFIKAEFDVESRVLDLKSGTLIVIIATKF